MIKIFDDISNSKTFYISVFIIVMGQLLLAFQGFDVCDDGFVLTFYQQIFNDPKSVEYNFIYWLSGLIGGIWYEIYPSGGIFWFRILAILVNTSTFIFSYKLLKGYIQKAYIIVGLTIVLFVNNYGFLTFYHNHITALLAVLGMFFLVKGLTKEKYVLLFIAGFLISINVFSRLPNITLFVFFMAIPLKNILNKERITLKPLLYATAGSLFGFAIIYIALISLRQIDVMENALMGLIDLGKTDGSSHNVFSLAKTYVGNYIKLVEVGLQLALLVCIRIALDIVKKRLFFYYLLGVLFFFFTLFWLKKADIYFVYVLGYIGSLGILFGKKNDTGLKLIAFLAFLMLFFLPIGSGGGIKSSGYMCIWLSVPLFFHFVSQVKNVRIELALANGASLFVINKDKLKRALTTFFVAYASLKVYSMSQEAYFDPGCRFLKTHKIESELARGVYTTKRRADIINELLHVLKDYVKPNDYLLVYDKMPVIHFLTHTRPYLHNPWVWIYDSHSFSEHLKRAEKETYVLPVIVQQKFETIFDFSEPTAYYLTDKIQLDSRYNNGFDLKRVKAMNAFILKHDYHIIWSNDYFNIFMPNITK